MNINDLSQNDYTVKSTPAPLNINSLTPGSYAVANSQTANQETPQDNSVSGTLLQPLKEGVSGLKDLYGGGQNGIASKLGQDVKEGANDIQQGTQKGGFSGAFQALKGLAKTGLRTAGDIAGTIYAPIGAAIGATGIGKATDAIGKSIVNSPLGNAITDNKSLQDFATSHPNAGEDFGRLLNLYMASGEKGKIEPSTLADRTDAQGQKIVNKITPDVFTKPVEQLRSEKLKSGLEEQNDRLKSADKSFNANTKVYKAPDGTSSTVTPIDTLVKYNIAPTIEKGSINMGDYRTGDGALGRIKTEVGSLDNQITDKLKTSGTGAVPIDDFKTKAIQEIMKDPTLKQQGKVASTITKVNSIFDDYKNSYGDTMPEVEINEIRKVMNQDFSPDTMDVSRVLGDTARKIIYDVTKDNSVRDLLRQQGELLAARKYGETINGTKVTGGKLGNMAMRTVGAVAGSTLHNLPVLGPLLGAVGGEYTSRALQQSQFTDFGAEAKSKVQSLLQRSNNSTQIQSATNIPSISKSIPLKR